MNENPLLPEEISPGWLEAANERYRAAEIPPIGRPFRALAELSKETGRTIRFDSAAALLVFEWFKANTKPGSHAIGALFTGAFYYDTCFWPLTVPVFYGEVRFDPIDALQTMPPSLKERLWNTGVARQVFIHYWVDCFDYALGFNEFAPSGPRTDRLGAFVVNGNAQLTGAYSQLLMHRPNPTAILGFGLATEIFLKAFLLKAAPRSDEELKKIGHDVSKLARACHAERPLKEFEIIRQSATAFPPISDRYDGPERKLSEVFDAAFVAQLSAAVVTREITGRDSREQIFGKQAP